MFLFFAFSVVLLPAPHAAASEASITLRDIYSSEAGQQSFALASLAGEDHATGDADSASTFYSAPSALKLSFEADAERAAVGIQFRDAGNAADPFAISPDTQIAGGLEFWINPQAVRVPSFSIGLLSDAGGKEVETRLPVSKYLADRPAADQWTRIVVPFRDFPATGFTYDAATKQSAPMAFDWSRVSGLRFSADTAGGSGYEPSVDNIRFVNTTIEPVHVDGQNMVTDAGDPLRFWGVNLASVYPTHEQAEKLAANLASRGINVVRLHHLMRNSLDWNTVSQIGPISGNTVTTREPNPEAWDRFDYLTAQLRARGIYIQLSLDSSRKYLPGDVDILQTNDEDRADWMAAMTDLNKVPSNVDLVRILPMIDERSALLMEEFAGHLLTHVNPYTGNSYGSDPQVLYLETMNETSSEYAIVAGNKFQSANFPNVSYWDNLLQDKWAAYSSDHGIAPSNVYTPSNAEARGEFLRELDETYFNRMKSYVGDLNVQTPIIFSNLWRGESFQKMQAADSDLIEDHNYVNPFVANGFDDVFQLASRSAVAGKPYFVGELNQQLKDQDIVANAPYRPMLLLAASAYGSLNEWSGIDWFAWEHGDRMLGADGWSIWEERQPAVPADMIGELESDGMMLDHMRTSGILFKNALAAKSVDPITLYVDDPTNATSYSTLMQPKYDPKPGWANVSGIRRAFGPVPPGQSDAPWMTASPANPIVSDTGEIAKDTARKQLTVAATQAEAFSGVLDGSPPAKLNHLQISGGSGTATVIAVSNDGNDFASSGNLIVSRTALDADNKEVIGPSVTLSGIREPAAGMAWYAKRTRPRGETGYEPLPMSAPGRLTLPDDGWHEIELQYAPIGSLPERQSGLAVGDPIRPVFGDSFRIAGVFNPASGGFSLNSAYVIDPSTTLAPAEGDKSLRLKLTAGFDLTRVGINFMNSVSQPVQLDFTSLKQTAGLHLWVYTKRKEDSFSVLLASDNNGKLVESRVPLSDYLSAGDYGNKWVEVTIPFADFPDTGIYYDSGTNQSTSMPFAWDRVKGIGFSSSTISGYYDPYVDDVGIVYTSLPDPNPGTGGGEGGDLNGDGSRTVGDLGIAVGHYGERSADSDWEPFEAADLNADGIIDISDLEALAAQILD